MREIMVHSTARVDFTAVIGKGTQIWHEVQVREGAVIGEDCIIGKGVYIGVNVHIGNRCKIQNYVCLYEGVTLGNGVFIGSHCVMTNDRYPRAITYAGELKKSKDWVLETTIVEDGASIGANATILPGITIGRGSMIGAGAVVTKDTLAGVLYVGNPARPVGEAHE